ncbi:MAG: ComF family protein [Acidimicrobiia bacterium]|nr:ComF family protein [Acidimicrobiia bacterium]
MPAPEPLATLTAVFVYTGVGREMLTRLKYRNQRASIGWLATAMATALPEHLHLNALTWAPTSAQRRRRRGFDQAELLARALGRKIGLPVVSVLRRIDAAGQTGLNRSQRVAAPEFAVRGSPQGAILVLDDVITTAATLRAAAYALLQAGVQRVDGVVAAATPITQH